jgi:hypothetical protein
VTISRADIGPNERDTQIAIALAFGLSQEDTGKRVCTIDFPSGVTPRTVYNRVKTNGGYIDSVIKFVRTLRGEREQEVKQLNKTNVKAELETLLGEAVATLRKALAEGDVKAASEVLDRVLGKSSQVHKHEGDVNVNHRVWQPERALVAQERDMLASNDLLLALPAETLEAEAEEIA